MRTLLLILLVCSLATGCASKYGTSHTNVHYYNACYAPISKLRASEYNVEKTTAGGAAIGAIGGALLGFLATGKAEGAVVGGIAGAATGAVVGNIYAKKKKISDDNARMASYLEDIDGDIRNLDIVSASAKQSLQCYDREFKELLRAIRERRISRMEAEDRFGEIASGRDEAIALLGNAVTHGRDLDQQYESAFREERKAMQRKNARPGRVAQVERRKQTFSTKVSDLDRQKREAQNRSLADKQQFSKRLAEIDA
ncbi:MAG: hypothetical protein K5657_03395 [Desulfovibrio sp.]|nr:hypothetical protein [Desulfovibrio sp.]